jgi:hypothetical protein
MLDGRLVPTVMLSPGYLDSRRRQAACEMTIDTGPTRNRGPDSHLALVAGVDARRRAGIVR